MELSGLGKLGAVVAVVVIGADLYSRWTGAIYHLDLLGANPLGAATTAAQQAGAATTAAQLAALTTSSGPPPAATASLPPPPATSAAPPSATALGVV